MFKTKLGRKIQIHGKIQMFLLCPVHTMQENLHNQWQRTSLQI